MARTMKWPPIPEGGRIPFVEGVDASVVLVVSTLSDLRQNPFNPQDLSLGEVTFNSQQSSEARIRSAMNRLRTVVFLDEVTDSSTPEDKADGQYEYTIVFTDRETRQQAEVPING